MLLELGFKGGRTGCRTLAAGRTNCWTRCPAIRGGCAWPAWPATRADRDRRRAREDGAAVEAYFDRFAEAVQLADRRNAFATEQVILTAGGSSYYDIVGRRLRQIELRKPAVKILRSGCYITHDCGTYVEHQAEMTQARSGAGQGARRAGSRPCSCAAWCNRCRSRAWRC